jgi:hypothetical protein
MVDLVSGSYPPVVLIPRSMVEECSISSNIRVCVGPQIGMNPKPILDSPIWNINISLPIPGSPHTNMGIPFFVFFFQSRTRSAFSHQTDNNTAKTPVSPFLMRGMRWGAPRSSRRALTPRRVGAHPARVGARLRLDAPRRGGNGGGVGSDAVAGGAGADWATCLSLLERAAAAAAAADVARDGAALTAASSTSVGGGVSSFRAAN